MYIYTYMCIYIYIYIMIILQPAQESATISPYMRIMLEVGYETLSRAGRPRHDSSGTSRIRFYPLFESNRIPCSSNACLRCC